MNGRRSEALRYTTTGGDGGRRHAVTLYLSVIFRKRWKLRQRPQ